MKKSKNMKQPKFYRPSNLQELWNVLDQYGEEACLMGGGTDVLVHLHEGDIAPRALVDVKGIESFHELDADDASVRIGAAVTFNEIKYDPNLQRVLPALSCAAGKVGAPPIQRKGTLVGNILTASPAGDGFVVAYGLDAQLTLLDKNGQKSVDIKDFILGPGKTDIHKDEIISGVTFSNHSKWQQQSFFKVGRRNSLAISVANGVVALAMNENGTVNDARICVGAVGPTPMRVCRAEELMKTQALSEELIESVGAIVSEEVKPITDLRASKDFRRHIVGVYVKRILNGFMKEQRHGH
jgi:CO/xanthine dehydrogenase FAD-binding subunit